MTKREIVMGKYRLFLSLVAISGLIIGLGSRISRAEEDPHIRNLEKRIKALETIVQPPEVAEEEEIAPEKKPLLYETLLEKKFLEGIEIFPGLRLSGLLEVNVEYENVKKKEEEDEKNSDLTAAFDLGLDIDVIKYVHGHVVLSWDEEGSDSDVLDEAIITLGTEDDFPYFLSAGKLDVPFGVYESHFISDPLTLELGETQETALLLGVEHDLFAISVGAFRGDVQKVDKDSRINGLVVGLDLTPVEGLTAGVSYLSDIADSDGLVELIPDGELKNYVGGLSAYFILEIGPVTLNGEYLGALKKFENIPDPEDKGTDLEGMEPKAWNFEVAYLFEDTAWEIALRYEGSDDFPGFPEKQGGICVAWGIFPNTSLSAEYLYGELKNGDKRNFTSAQLAFEF